MEFKTIYQDIIVRAIIFRTPPSSPQRVRSVCERGVDKETQVMANDPLLFNFDIEVGASPTGGLIVPPTLMFVLWPTVELVKARH